MISSIPVDMLEKRAADQRRQLHNSVSELRHSLREKLDVKRNVRQYLWPSVLVMALIGLVAGYSMTGIFTGD